MTIECKTCAYFMPIRGSMGNGRCVRFPKAEVKDEHDWCGEWRAHPAGGPVDQFGGKG